MTYNINKVVTIGMTNKMHFTPVTRGVQTKKDYKYQDFDRTMTVYVEILTDV